VLIKATRVLISTTQQELTPDMDFTHQIVRTTMQQDIEDQTTCHLCVCDLKKQGYIAESKILVFDRQSIRPCLHIKQSKNGQPINRNEYRCDTS